MKKFTPGLAGSTFAIRAAPPEVVILFLEVGSPLMPYQYVVTSESTPSTVNEPYWPTPSYQGSSGLAGSDSGYSPELTVGAWGTLVS